MAQFIQLPSLSLLSCYFCIFIFILFALHFWALAKICIFNSPLPLSLSLYSLTLWESFVFEFAQQLLLLYALRAKVKQRINCDECETVFAGLVDGFVTCGNSSYHTIHSFLTFRHSNSKGKRVSNAGFQILSWPGSIAWLSPNSHSSWGSSA